MGNATAKSQPTPVEENALFRTEILGGGSTVCEGFRTQTKSGIDGAIALLVSHLCCTFFGAAQILSRVEVNIATICNY